jgi:hypothetical protein
MARSLADVLHYFIPEVPSAEGDAFARRAAAPAVPTLALPLGDGDVVRAALVWNLAVEVSRLGHAGSIVAPALEDSASLWPDPGAGPLGTELVLTFAEDAEELATATLDVATTRSGDGASGLIWVRVPPAWIEKGAGALPFLEHVLLLTSPDPRDVRECYAMAKRCIAAGGRTIGVIVHGARSVSEASEVFSRLARTAERHLGRTLRSYGLLVDDLHVYRSIVSRRPIGLTHPHSPAAKALRDVARWIAEDISRGELG